MILRIDNIILILLLAVSLSGCGPSEIERLEKEVLDIHDEVMPWLDDMKVMRSKLIKSQFETSVDSSKAVEASIALHRTDSMMWAWMYQYKTVDNIRDSMTDQQIKYYLQRQRKSISIVNQSMKEAVAKADELLKN